MDCPACRRAHSRFEQMGATAQLEAIATQLE